MISISEKSLKKRRSIAVTLIVLFISLLTIVPTAVDNNKTTEPLQTEVLSQQVDESTVLAAELLNTLEVKGRAPKTGYTRSEFGDGWAKINGCDTRNRMLARGMNDVVFAEDKCIVLSGTLVDSYSGNVIKFTRGASTSAEVQIDHVVALSDSWQKGAQNLDFGKRVQLANDPLNLLAVDGPINQQKGDADAASWLPPNKRFRCQYVARQIAVKARYKLWVTDAEKSTMKRVLSGCTSQVVPIEL